MTQEFIDNLFILILFMAIGAIALGAAQLVINLIRARRRWRRD